MRVDEGRRGLKSSRDKNGGAYLSGEGGEDKVARLTPSEPPTPSLY